MPRQPICSDEQIIKELKKGTAEATVGHICHCHPRRVRSVKEKYEEATGEKIVLRDKRYLKKEKPDYQFITILGRDPRSHKESWIEYMKNNPFYFQSTFDLDPTESNIVDTANNDEVVSFCFALGA